MDTTALTGLIAYGLQAAQLIDAVTHGFSLAEVPEAYALVMNAKVEIAAAKPALAEYLALSPVDQATVEQAIQAAIPVFADVQVGPAIQTVLNWLIQTVPVIQLVVPPQPTAKA